MRKHEEAVVSPIGNSKNECSSFKRRRVKRLSIKGLLCVLLSVILSVLTVIPCLAKTGMVELVDDKAAPSIVSALPSGEAVTFIGGKDIVSTQIAEHEIGLWSYAERQTAPESVRNELGYAYSVLRSVSSLGELEAQLDAEAQKLNGSYSAAAFIVSDLIDITLPEEQTALLHSSEELYLCITFRYNATAEGSHPVVIRQNPTDKTWSLAGTTNQYGDDLVTVNLSAPGPIAILTVDQDRMESREASGIEKYVWVPVLAILVVIFASAALFVVFYRKGHAKV